MAFLRKRAGGWRAEISVQGKRESATFSTKAEASAWASERETTVRRQQASGIVAGRTCQEAFDRYAEEVSVTKAGRHWEEIRLRAIAAHRIDGRAIGGMLLSDVTSDTIGKWRELRLKTVKGSTINRDLNLLSNVFTIARREWKWIATSPTTDVRRPKDSKPRERRITEEERDRLCLALGYDGTVHNLSSAVAVAFLFAIETGMRAGEITGLTWSSVKGNVAHLAKTKNGTKRDVPLSGVAVGLLAQLPKTSPTCFGITSKSLDALFRKARARAAIVDMTFHDTRHEAITRLAKKLNVLELARMVGHKDLRMLQIYYNETAHEIAKKL